MQYTYNIRTSVSIIKFFVLFFFFQEDGDVVRWFKDTQNIDIVKIKVWVFFRSLPVIEDSYRFMTINNDNLSLFMSVFKCHFQRGVYSVFNFKIITQ